MQHVGSLLQCVLFLAARGLSSCGAWAPEHVGSVVAASRGHSSSRCAGLSPSRPLLLRSTGSSRAGSVIVAHGLSCSEACGIFPDQGLNPCPLHWQADSQPLRHQGSPAGGFLTTAPPGKPLIRISISLFRAALTLFCLSFMFAISLKFFLSSF